jgi:hypothetical protein
MTACSTFTVCAMAACRGAALVEAGRFRQRSVGILIDQQPVRSVPLSFSVDLRNHDLLDGLPTLDAVQPSLSRVSYLFFAIFSLILQRLQLSPEGLTQFLAQKQDWPKALGPVDQIRAMAIAAGGRFFKGIPTSRLLFAR